MVAVFTGLGAGFERGSAAQIGSAGLLGGGVQGRGGDRISVNATTGNLLINRQDEFLVGRGPDVGISRTYNSLGALDENGDHWRQSTDKRIRGWSNNLNQDDAFLYRVSADGSDIKYTYSGGAYRTTEGSGSHDSVIYTSGEFIWTDGDTGVKEVYTSVGASGGWRVTEQIDRDGNALAFAYLGGRLTSITTADGGKTEYTWSGNNITSIKSTYVDSADITRTLTRTHYTYDGSDRLIKVITDLTPEDNDAQTTGSDEALEGVQNESYVTTYTYHGTSNRVASITQTDGSEVVFDYDEASGRITLIKQTVASGNIRETQIDYDGYITTVTDPIGAETKLYYDDKGQLLQIVAPSTEPGRAAQVVQYEYDNEGNLLRTINTDTDSASLDAFSGGEGNLIETQDWGGGQDALRGANLIDDSGWPQDIDDVPTGPATVAGWGGAAYASEATWVSTAGPYDEDVISLHAGQLDSDNIGGGQLTHEFEIDGTKDYEFTYYFKADELNKHRIYFGLSRYGVVKDGTTGNVQNNPYFTYDFANANTGIEAGKWYKLVGYVLSQGSGAASVGSYGGVYSVENGAKVRNLRHFVWNENRTTNESYSRFFNVYNPENQGQFTHFYKPEVREVGSANILQGSAALDVVRDRALVETPRVDEWQNTTKFVADGEARWTETDGPNGGRSVVLETGQFDQGNSGGGNQTNNFTIDGSKTYKFTQYFRKSDLSKHWIYFGLKADADAVEYAHNGSANTNPYFMSMNDDIQRDTLIEDRWYKVEGYVLAENSANQTYGTLGGIYDTVTGEKVYDTHTFRWNENRSPDTTTSYARFFTFYDEFEHGWSTQWSAPEVIKISNGAFDYDESGEITQFAYDERGNITQIIDAKGYVTDNLYDADNNLTRTSSERSYEGGAAELGHARFVYDVENHLKYSISADGRVTEYRYDGHGSLTHEIQYTQHSYSTSSTVPTLQDMDVWRNNKDRTESQLTSHIYDVQGNVNRTITYGITTASGGSTDLEGYSELLYTYDSAGRLLSSKTSADVGSTYAYDGLGRTISTTDLNGGTTTIVFNDAATQTVITSAGGSVTTSTYNKAGDLISQINSGDFDLTAGSYYKYDKNGRPRVMRDATGNKTFYVYDKVGNKTAEVDGVGYVQEFRYDKEGRQIAHVRYASHKTSGERSTLIADLENPNNTLTVQNLRSDHHGSNIWQWSAYDAVGQMTRTVLGDGAVTEYEYDVAGRLVKTYSYANKLTSARLAELRDGTVEADSFSPIVESTKDQIHRTFYDLDGMVVGTLNGDGYLTKNKYDHAGRLIQESTFVNKASNLTGTFDQVDGSVEKSSSKDIHTRYVYNGQGHLRFTIDVYGRVTENVYRQEGDPAWHAIGLVRATIQHAESLTGAWKYKYTDVKAQVDALDKADSRTSWAVYNNRNQLAFSINATGAVTRFNYDSRGNVTKTTQFKQTLIPTDLPTEGEMHGWAQTGSNSAYARVSRNFYTARNVLRFSVDAENYITRYDYDHEDRLTREIRWKTPVFFPDGSTTLDVHEAEKGGWVDTEFSYDHQGRLSSVYDANGTRTFTNYWANGTVASQIRAFGHGRDFSRVLHVYNAAGQLANKFEYIADQTTNTQHQRNQTNYTYDGLGNLIEVLDTIGTHKNETDNQTFNTPNQITKFTYDKRGNVLTQTNAEDGVTSFEYNAFGQVTKTTDPRENVSYNYYNAYGQLTASVDAENYATQTTYTVFGEVKTVTRRYLPAQVIPSFSIDTNELDNKTTYSYDKLGQVTRVTDALGGYEQYTYTAFGQQASVRNKLGGYTYYTYDKRGQMTQSRVVADIYNSAGTKVSPNITNQYEYDSRGNQTKMVEAINRPAAEQRTTIYVYDNADQLIEKRGDAVDVYSSGTDDSAQTETPTEYYTYDRRGNLIESENANGARTLYFYDRMDRVTHQLSSEGTLVRNFYDANSNLMETRIYETKEPLPTNALGTPTAGSGAYRLTTFAYDRLNRMTDSYVHNVQTAKFDGSLTLTGYPLHTQYEYDANGNVTKVIDPNGGETVTTYDKLGRKDVQTDPAGYNIQWLYDANSNVKRELRYGTGADDHRITDFTYDKNGNRKTETRLAVKIFNGTTGATTQNSTITYQYNALGQVTRKAEATGDFIEYDYDTFGRVNNETRTAYADHTGQTVTPRVDYYYNGLNELSLSRIYGQNGASHAYTNFEYEAGGRLLSKTDAEGLKRTYRYDAKGQVVREEYVREGNDEGIGYSYDLEGRVTSQGVVAKPGSSWSRSDLTDVQTSYNAFGEVSERGTNGVYAEIFDYDNAGRVWRTTSGDGAYKYFFYDANGNQTVSVTSDGTNIDNKTVDQLIDFWDTRPITDFNRLAINHAEGLNVTITKYDARNLAIQVLEPQRELTSTAGSRVTLETFRSYNAFGDVASETDARGNTIDYSYNTMGRRIKVESPSVSITHVDGTVDNNHRPTEHYYYDISGRLVASRDANQSRETPTTYNLTSQTLLAGTGYNGFEALITQTMAADGGTVTTAFDIQGNARTITNQLGHITTQTFDRMGRVTQIKYADPDGNSANGYQGLTDYYAYDGLGQQIQHWNNELGTGNKQLTTHDAEGRVISQRSFGGDITANSYAWNGSLVTNGLGLFGGWEQITTYANLKTSTVHKDVFGREVYKNDLGENEAWNAFNKGGQLAYSWGRNAGSSVDNWTTSHSYFNTGKLSQSIYNDGVINSPYSAWSTRTTTFRYDETGNLIHEKLTDTGRRKIFKTGTYSYFGTYNRTLTNATSHYDALGRIEYWEQAGNTTLPYARKDFEYDANGNIRRTLNKFYNIGNNGNFGAAINDGRTSKVQQIEDYWYTFDSMNRVIISQGTRSGSTIITGAEGVQVTYDAAGQRRSTLSSGGNEHYNYDDAGRLEFVRAYSQTGAVRAAYIYDKMGRLKTQNDYVGSNYNINKAEFSRNILTYNAKGQIFHEETFTRRDNEIYENRVWNFYNGETTLQNNGIATGGGAPMDYALGAVSATRSDSYIDNDLQDISWTKNSYVWRDAALQSEIEYKPEYNKSETNSTDFFYNERGQLNSTWVDDGRDRLVSFWNDSNGQVIDRDEDDVRHDKGDPREIRYRFGGKEMGYTGNNGTLDTNYTESIGNRTTEPYKPADWAFRDGERYGVQHDNFDQSYEAINSYDQGSIAGSYTVRSGDTLQGIAANLYGDSSLWYKIAQANGLGGQSSLIEGQALRLPVGVTRNTHNVNTFQPYNPGEAIGEVSPTIPTPKKQKCGVFGQIILAVVAIAIQFIPVVGQIATFIGTTIGSAVGAVAGSTIGGIAGSFASAATVGAISSAGSQAVGVATGIQDKFSWKQVGLAAIGAGIKAVNPIGGAVGASISSAATQGIGKITGLQDSFSWAGVAAAGVGSFVGDVAAVKLPGFDFLGGNHSKLNQIGSSAAAIIANAATRSAIEGSSFGDNVIAAIPDVVGQAFGVLAGDSLTSFFEPLQIGNQNPTSQVSSQRNETVLGEVAYGPQDDQFNLNLGEGFSLLNQDLFATSIATFDEIGFGVDKAILGALNREPTARQKAQLYLDDLAFDLSTSRFISSGEGGDFVGGVLGSLASTISHPWDATKRFGTSIATAPANLTTSLFSYSNAATYVAFGDTESASFYLGYANSHLEEGSWGVVNGLTLGRGLTLRAGLGQVSKVRASGHIDDGLYNLSVDPNIVRYSQKSHRYKTDGGIHIRDLAESMRVNGWRGNPIDVVQMNDGLLTSVGNRRLSAARSAGIDLKATLRGFDELLPKDYAAKLLNAKTGVGPKTYGELVESRIKSQGSVFRHQSPNGSFNLQHVSLNGYDFTKWATK